MLRSFLALLVNLALFALLMVQVTPEGNLLMVEYKGLLIVAVALLICAMINAAFLAMGVGEDMDDWG